MTTTSWLSLLNVENVGAAYRRTRDIPKGYNNRGQIVQKSAKVSGDVDE